MKLIIPSALADVTVLQWMKYRNVCTVPDFDDEVDRLALVTIFCNIAIDEALSLRAADFDETVNQVRKVLTMEPRLIQTFSIRGIEYGVIPNFDEMTASEFIDLDGYAAQDENSDAFLAVAYRPVSQRLPKWLRRMVPDRYKNLYNIEDYAGSEKYRAKMHGASLEVLLGLRLFFYNIATILVNDTPQLLEEAAKGQTEEVQAILTQSGAGISHFTQ